MTEGISQLQDLLDADKFKEVILAGITTAEKWLELGEKAVEARQFSEAEDLWIKAWNNMSWIGLNIIQRRLRLGKSEGGEIRGRFRKFWMRLAVFGIKKKVAKAKAAAMASVS
jgi:hypothetical protein